MQKLISFVIPIFNEQENIKTIYLSVFKKFNSLKSKYEPEFIFVDDGSTDKSIKILNDLALKNNKVKYLEFSRNFGKEIATTAGIHYAKGDAVIIMDADLQHPPEKIAEFITKWEDGAEIVTGIRQRTKGKSIMKRIGSYYFYKINSAISGIKSVPNSTDFRLLDKKVIKEFIRFTEKNRMTRGLIDWLGFKNEYVYFVSPERKFGKPGYSYLKLTRLAFTSFVSNSLIPLKLAGYLGIIITVLFALLGIFVFLDRYFLHDPFGFHFTNLAIVVVFIGFLIGIVLSCLGLMALYIGNINTEITNRPLYVLRNKKNF